MEYKQEVTDAAALELDDIAESLGQEFETSLANMVKPCLY